MEASPTGAAPPLPPSRAPTSAAAAPRGRELHVFDFDGTIVRSPVPHPSNGAAVLEHAQKPAMFGGLGWFGALETLRPPCFPNAPDPRDDRYFVQATLATFRASQAAGHYVIVLTGRDEIFRPRVTELLSLAGLAPAELHLKAKVRAGTVRAKTDTIMDVVSRVRPTAIRLFDDRLEQGTKIAASVEEALAAAGAPAGAVPVLLVHVDEPETYLEKQLENDLLWRLKENAAAGRFRKS